MMWGVTWWFPWPVTNVRVSRGDHVVSGRGVWPLCDQSYDEKYLMNQDELRWVIITQPHLAVSATLREDGTVVAGSAARWSWSQLQQPGIVACWAGPGHSGLLTTTSVGIQASNCPVSASVRLSWSRYYTQLRNNIQWVRMWLMTQE